MAYHSGPSMCPDYHISVAGSWPLIVVETNVHVYLVRCHLLFSRFLLKMGRIRHSSQKLYHLGVQLPHLAMCTQTIIHPWPSLLHSPLQGAGRKSRLPCGPSARRVHQLVLPYNAGCHRVKGLIWPSQWCSLDLERYATAMWRSGVHMCDVKEHYGWMEGWMISSFV